MYVLTVLQVTQKRLTRQAERVEGWSFLVMISLEI